jgi:hypothetical protein
MRFMLTVTRTSLRPKSAFVSTNSPRSVLIFAQVTKMKASSKEQVYYTRERIDVCAIIIIMLVITALLIVPIYLLYRLVSVSSDSNRDFDKDGTATCIGVLLVFTLLFSAVLSVSTRAKRHEILGAAAG